MKLKLQKWINRVSAEDRSRLLYVLRFDANPKEFIELMASLREKYDFIPRGEKPEESQE